MLIHTEDRGGTLRDAQDPAQEPLRGILLVDKPEGWTSHDVTAKVRGLLRERHIGHGGTLDPMATGLLVLLVGKAARLLDFMPGTKR